MTLEYIRTLYRYNDWANAHMLEAASQLDQEQFGRDMGSSFASVRDTLLHMLYAEWIWLERWHGRSPEGAPDGCPTARRRRSIGECRPRADTE